MAEVFVENFVEKDKIKVLPLTILFVAYGVIAVFLLMLLLSMYHAFWFAVGIILFASPFILFFTKIHKTLEIGKSPVINPKTLLRSRKLPPALVGLVVDEFAGFEEIVATIIDLTFRGYINLKELPKNDIRLEKTSKSWDRLKFKYEKAIMEFLFSEKDVVKVSELKNKFGHKIPFINTLIYEEAVGRGLFKKAPYIVRKKYGRFLKLLTWIALFIIIGGIYAAAKLELFELFVFFVPLAIFGVPPLAMDLLVLNILSYIAPKKTRKGAYEESKYMETKKWLEAHKMSDVNMATEFLEYITAFSINDKYVRKFRPLSTIIGPKGREKSLRYETTVIRVIQLRGKFKIKKDLEKAKKNTELMFKIGASEDQIEQALLKEGFSKGEIKKILLAHRRLDKTLYPKT